VGRGFSPWHAGEGEEVNGNLTDEFNDRNKGGVKPAAMANRGDRAHSMHGGMKHG
jgi:hypothetical protein